MLSFLQRFKRYSGKELDNEETQKERIAQVGVEDTEVKVVNRGENTMNGMNEKTEMSNEDMKVAVASLYPETLKDLDLSFDESIYAIAFGLQDEICSCGREAVFSGLNMSAEKMHERVEYCLNEKMYKDYANALRTVLNDTSLLSDNGVTYTNYDELKQDFALAVEKLRTPTDDDSHYNRHYGCDNNYRYLLIQGIPVGKQPGLISLDIDGSTDSLYGQVRKLMDEVRFYDEIRNQALERIEKLMIEIKQRQDCPKDFGIIIESPQTELDESTQQLVWPYRSAELFRQLGLNTLDEIIQYFCDFDNFVNSDDKITLREWWVVTTILRKKELLSMAYYAPELDDEIDQIELSVRAETILRRQGLNDFDDIAMLFASGAKEGSYRIKEMRNCGKVIYNEIMRKLSETSVKMNDSLCYLTSTSHVQALDFDKHNRMRLVSCGVKTVGELLAACRSENRFFSLRYIDYNLYCVAKRQLAKYGFVC